MTEKYHGKMLIDNVMKQFYQTTQSIFYHRSTMQYFRLNLFITLVQPE